MLENVLKNSSIQVKITVKSLISAGLVVAAALLPLLVHAVAGASGGATWLPMYLPVIVGGCLLGSVFGGAIGACSPVASYFISQAVLGAAMPAEVKLPYMILELTVFGLVAGLFAKKIAQQPLIAFFAVLIAQIAGKAVNLIVHAAVIAASGQGQYSSLITSIQKGLPGLCLQIVLVPLIILFFVDYPVFFYIT
ncbi:MAG: hypothetical protein EOM23_01720 [Candidatus Moranbacteria bacterium]|nr:hypothetical protein [Candidatus Moranbacteria bacterium]